MKPSLLFAVAFALSATASVRAADTVFIDATHPMQTIHAQTALGSTVDKEPAGSIPALYSKGNIQQMLAAGYGWLSYRLFTELSVQDWHWNPKGHFSTPNGGYWTSDWSPTRQPITDSYGYWLSHSGFTSDQGNNEGHSRLTDGDLNTYWKSNPYLTHRFTGDADADHPQWVIIDLGSPKVVDGIQLHFVNPYARRYHIQFWTGGDAINDPGHGTWRMFRNGTINAANLEQASAIHGIRSTANMPVRFVRVLLESSSNTCDSHGSSDIRNCVGYAITEISLGRFDDTHILHDLLIHNRCGGEKAGIGRCGRRQSATYVSSVDPWHDASRRVRNQEQPGLDLIARSGLTRNLPALYPVPMLYSTPQNAVAEVRYLRSRGYALGGIELGEEPDGQYAEPEDYAALYVQWAKAIRALDPAVPLGGPIFSGVNDDLQTWADSSGNISWFNRFLKYLRGHNAMQYLSFMSFEHYPFDGCEHGTKLTNDLLQEPEIMGRVVNAWRRDGLPSSVPMYVTEANFSAVNFSETPMLVEGALWQADYMASALENGVKRVVYYQYEPVPLSQNKMCPADWGNLTMFVADTTGTISDRAAQFWAARMLSSQWLAPGNSTATLYRGSATAKLMNKPSVTVYPLRRPNGTWSVMLINKDTRAQTVDVRFNEGPHAGRFFGNVDVITFGPEQYQWHVRGKLSRPSPNGPPAHKAMKATSTTRYTLPGRSITVLRGNVRSGS